MDRKVWPGQQVRMLSSKAGQVCWLQGSEDVRDDIVSVNAIDQSSPVVVDKPAGHLNSMPGILAVVFLQASGGRQSFGVTFWAQLGTPPRKPIPPL